MSPHGTGLEDTPTYFVVIYERAFTLKFKKIKICLKNEFRKKNKLQNFSKRYEGLRSKTPINFKWLMAWLKFK